MPKSLGDFKRTHPSNQTQPRSCSCFPHSHNRVSPIPGDYPGFIILEIRPGRVIRVQHINPTSLESRQNYHLDNDHQQRLVMKHRKKQQIKSTSGHRLTRASSKIGTLFDGMKGDKPGDPPRAATSSSVHVDVSPRKPETASCIVKREILKLDGLHNDPMVDAESVLFFFHGVAGSSEVWRSQIDHFGRQGYEMVIPDLIGHGMSATPQNLNAYTFDEIASDLLVLFDLLCKKRNVLVGHSYGSSFAAVIARNRPTRVSKLIMISGGSPTPLAPQPGLFQAPVCCLDCFTPLLHHQFFKSAFHKKSKTCGLRDRAFDIPSYVLKGIMNGQIWDEGDAEFHEWINAPTLLIHGKHDQLVSVEEEKEMVDAIFDCNLVVVEDASHMVMMEKPSEVNELIQNFLLSNMRLVGSAVAHGNRVVTPDNNPVSSNSPTNLSVDAAAMDI